MAEDECREHYIDLLECYKNNRCLWDTGNSLYSNRDCRNQAHNSLLEVYKKIKEDANIADLKKKLDNMRTAYNREAKKVKKGSITGSGTRQMHMPTLWYYKYLTFLNENEVARKGRKTECNLPDEGYEYKIPTVETRKSLKRKFEESKTENEVNEDDSSIFTATSPISVDYETIIHDSVDARVNIFEDPECDYFGKIVSAKLKKMEESQRYHAERIILHTLLQGSTNQLNEFTDVRDSQLSRSKDAVQY